MQKFLGNKTSHLFNVLSIYGISNWDILGKLMFNNRFENYAYV